MLVGGACHHTDSWLNCTTMLQMLTHLGDFPARLGEQGRAVYEYTPCPPVGYPELEAELW